ncbi:PQ loop repeat-domain-containing protein [Pisolithus albus]|nr:PQ loop repeat-domain-containing protein [Pisolithus albus]
MFIQNPSELLGYVSIACWLGAQFPQILENVKQQSCESLALPFLFNWMLGDASNLIGCLLTHQLPFQTYLALYFCSVDCCLLGQFFYYGGGPKIPPNSYAYPRSRSASLVRPHSLDTSRYRTLSAAAGSVAAAAALAAHSDSRTEHRHRRKGEDEQLLEERAPSHVSVEVQDEVDHAVPSALSDSYHSDSGNRKRISWSQERDDRHLNRHRRPVSPVVHTACSPLRMTSTQGESATQARGRQLQRDGDLEQDEEERRGQRTGSRASRRGAGMVFLGVWVLFGIGGLAGSQYRPIASKSTSIGTVLVSKSGTSPLAQQPAAPGLLYSSYPSIYVQLPTPPVAVGSHMHSLSEEFSPSERVIGRIFAWLCTTLYLTSRLPQIWKNYVRKSVEGLSIYLFVFAFLGNFFYVCSILTSPNIRLPPPASTEFVRESIPYLLGSGGTFIFDITIVSQYLLYKGRRPRTTMRSRGNSLVRSTTAAEERAALLRTDTLPHSYTDRGSSIIARGQTNRVSTLAGVNDTADHLRTLVLDYLCHNCYTKTAQAFSKESAVRHLDRDGNEIVSESSYSGQTSELSTDVIRTIGLRECIRTHILSGRVEEAICCLNEHFPKVLDEKLGEEADTTAPDDTSDDRRLQYRKTTVNPVHLSLNLRILAFIEACRTLPLSYPDPSHESTIVHPPPTESSVCDTVDEERRQTELLIRARKLYAHVNSLRKPANRSIYERELKNVFGLLAYKVPEKSPIVKYLSQERRERVAEQVDCAILCTYNMDMPVISDVELAVRYTHCLWSTLHTMRSRLPPRSRWPAGVSLLPDLDDKTSVGSEKEPPEVSQFSNCFY